MALYDDQGIKSSKIERKRAWLLSQKLHELDESDQEPFLLYSYGKVFQCMHSIGIQIRPTNPNIYFNAS